MPIGTHGIGQGATEVWERGEHLSHGVTLQERISSPRSGAVGIWFVPPSDTAAGATLCSAGFRGPRMGRGTSRNLAKCRQALDIETAGKTAIPLELKAPIKASGFLRRTGRLATITRSELGRRA